MEAARLLFPLVLLMKNWIAKLPLALVNILDKGKNDFQAGCHVKGKVKIFDVDNDDRIR